MSRLATIDLTFLLLENQVRPMHMASCLILDPPRGEEKTFVSRLLQAFRSAQPVKPFNQKLKWLEGGIARWEHSEPDPLYHVRHVAVPAPGTSCTWAAPLCAPCSGCLSCHPARA